MLVIIWIMFCIAVAIFANRYKRNAIGWFVFAFFLSPLLGFVFLLALGPLPDVQSAPTEGASKPAERPQEGGAGLNPMWPTEPAAAPPTDAVGASVADPGRTLGSTVTLTGLAVIVLGLIGWQLVQSGTENKPSTTGFTTVVEPSKAIAQTVIPPERFACSKSAVLLPYLSPPKTLQACRDHVRQWKAALIANIRVSNTCRDEWLKSLPSTMQNTGSAAKVRDSIVKSTALIPAAERGFEEQLKKNNTLAKCLSQLDAAQKLSAMQPEFRGRWQGN